MKRIQETNINTPEEYNRIFSESPTTYSQFDIRRWNIMLRFFRGGKLVDFGCFDSDLCHMAKQRYPNAAVWGLDLADKAIEYMQGQYPDINFLVKDVTQTEFEDASFNYVTAGELLEHIESPEIVIKEAIRILKPGGIFALSVPLEETGEGEVDKERHLWSFGKKDLIELLKPHGVITFWILGSDKYPTYEYHFPVLICWCQHYASID